MSVFLSVCFYLGPLKREAKDNLLYPERQENGGGQSWMYKSLQHVQGRFKEEADLFLLHRKNTCVLTGIAKIEMFLKNTQYLLL